MRRQGLVFYNVSGSWQAALSVQHLNKNLRKQFYGFNTLLDLVGSLGLNDQIIRGDQYDYSLVYTSVGRFINSTRYMRLIRNILLTHNIFHCIGGMHIWLTQQRLL